MPASCSSPAASLIIISGFPASGKTRRARQLQAFFDARIAAAAHEGEDEHRAAARRRLRVHRISDDTLGLPRAVYHTARAEKDARAAAFSAVTRALSRDDVVLADGLNYIKGYRYQLHCEAKEARTPACVLTGPEVHVGTPVETCRAWNAQRLAAEAAAAAATTNTTTTAPGNDDDGAGPGAYAAEDFENLVVRYEEPNGMARWDSPLFTVLPDDEHPPYERIWEALVGADGRGKVVRPNQATVLKPAAGQDALYELDHLTSDIVGRIQAWQRDHPDEAGGAGGGEVPIPDAEQPIRLPAAGPLSSPQLQRLRRQFVALNRQHALEKGRLGSLFVDYLNDWFERE